MKPIDNITLPVALKLNSESFLNLEDFFSRASENEYTMFTHRNYYYSAPHFGEKWPSGIEYQYHGVEVKCAICGHQPGRNVASVGTMFICKDGSSNPRRATILCKDHILDRTRYVRNRKPRLVQLTLF